MRHCGALAALAAIAWCGGVAARADMSGAAYVNVTASGSGSSFTCSTERMQVATIYNDSASATGTLHMRVWYTNNDDFFTPGYPVADYNMGTMAGYATVSNFDHTVNCSTTPPNGDYCVTMALEDFTNQTTEDYVKFAGCQHWPPNQACSTGLSCTAGQYYTPSSGGSSDGGYGSGGALDWRSLLLLAGLALLAGTRRFRALASP